MIRTVRPASSACVIVLVSPRRYWIVYCVHVCVARSKKQEFIEKLRQLQRKLEQSGYSDPDCSHNANFNREKLLADAYRFIMGNTAKELRRRRLNVHWGREEGWGGEECVCVCVCLGRESIGKRWSRSVLWETDCYTLPACPFYQSNNLNIIFPFVNIS